MAGTKPVPEDQKAAVLTQAPLEESASPPQAIDDQFLKDYLHRMRNFDKFHDGDIVLDAREMKLLNSTVEKFKKVQDNVGHGNFYLLSFDEALGFARQNGSIGAFTPEETEFLEKIFYEDAAKYGFLGDKPLPGLTDAVKKDVAYKVPHTGNWLYKGKPLETYETIKGILGDKVILTSGVRSVVKQFLLFLSKAQVCRGNLSQASRSLAPPGYSFHGVGDFDVGQKGLGARNFSSSFTETEVFKRLNDLGYIVLRYPKDNLLGVRFEPWHIKVAA